jgi:hypothetical protein
VAGLVLAYYWLLRAAVRARPGLRRCLCRCRHCGIFFLADPRNAGRRDLGCPFGCQEAHRRRESTRRSVAYYRGPEGKLKKRIQNSGRSLVAGRESESVAARGEPGALEPGEGPDERQSGEAPDECQSEVMAARTRHVPRSRWGEPLVEYVRLVCSFIEGRRVSRDEVVEMLGEVLRQHSMARLRRIDHVVRQLNPNPP